MLTNTFSRRAFLASAIALTAVPAFAQQSFPAPQMSAPEALEKVMNNELVLIDIRSIGEWRESGLPSVAIPMSMHQPGFLEKFTKLKNENPDKEIAMICATGGRTQYVQQELQKRGLGKTIDVSEGMMGNGKAAGWIKRGMPIKAYQ